jgi:hypothetical protein
MLRRAGVAFVAIVIGCVGIAGCKWPVSATSGPSLAVRVSGNHLVDENNQPLQLRGVNRSGTQYACVQSNEIFDGPTDSTALDAIKSWHANAIRVSLNEDCWLGINGVPAASSGTTYRYEISAYVDRINNLGMYVILDLHFNAPGTNKAIDQQPMPDRDHAPAFWSSVATAFKANPSVLFDIYNEPYPDGNANTTAAWTCVRDGGTCPGVGYTAAGSQELVNAIRNTGATNVIMVGGPQYAGVVDRWTTYKPADTAQQLAASIHIYFNTPENPDFSPCYLQSCWNATLTPLAATTPIVIGEFGEFDCAGGLINGSSIHQGNLLDFADAHGISYLAWSWIVASCTSEPSLISDYNGTPTAYGAVVRAHLLQH